VDHCFPFPSLPFNTNHCNNSDTNITNDDDDDASSRDASAADWLDGEFETEDDALFDPSDSVEEEDEEGDDDDDVYGFVLKLLSLSCMPVLTCLADDRQSIPLTYSLLSLTRPPAWQIQKL
jgi:hypothetical protein